MSLIFDLNSLERTISASRSHRTVSSLSFSSTIREDAYEKRPNCFCTLIMSLRYHLPSDLSLFVLTRPVWVAGCGGKRCGLHQKLVINLHRTHPLSLSSRQQALQKIVMLQGMQVCRGATSECGTPGSMLCLQSVKSVKSVCGEMYH